MGVIQLVRKKGLDLPSLRPFLRHGYTFVQWLHHNRKSVLKMVDGIRYELNLNEVIDSSIYFLGTYEPDLVSIIKRLIKQGDVILDVGANVGCHALLFSKLAGPQGRVIAFEPTTWAFQKLKRNRELNLEVCTKNLVLEKMAIADRSVKSQPVQFRSSWRLFGPKEQVEHELVDILTIDEYLEKHELARVDFIKVDVDGYEYKVIKGALRTLQVQKPVLMIEFGHYTLERVGDRLEALVDCLFSLGYAIRRDEEFYLFRDRSEILAAVSPNSTINVICLPDSDSGL
jgi:FkbM family methyltransferase